MAKLPSLTAKELERALIRLGFKAVRQKGSHVFYRHPDGRTTTIPHHKGRDLASPLVRSILKDIQMDSAAFAEFLSR